MAAFYHIDKERRLVMSSASGVLTRDDVRLHMQRLLSDPDFDPRFSQLADFTHLTKVDLSADEIRELAQNTIFAPDSRRAFIVGDDASAQLLETFAVLRKISGECGIRIFHTLDEGIDWILPRVTTR